MSQRQIIIEFKYKNNVYEIYDYPIDFNRIKDQIRKIIKISGEFHLSWQRTPNSDYINIVDDNNLQRCFEKQINNQAQSNPLEYIISLRVTEDFSQPQDPFAISKANEKDLSKSTQLQYHVGQKFINSSQENQFQNFGNAQPFVEYDKSKYTDINCYNCGGDNQIHQNGDQKCQICQGVGKLLKTKEIDTIEYLIEKKLCQLYPELKQIYKRFQQSGNQPEELVPSPANNIKNVQTQVPYQQTDLVVDANKNLLLQVENKDQPEKAIAAPQSQSNNELKIEVEDIPLKQEDSAINNKEPGKKKLKKKEQFRKLFSNNLNNSSPKNAGMTPGGDEQQKTIVNKPAVEIIKPENIPNITLSSNQILKSSDEMFSFDVFKHPYDKNEIVFRNNEKQVLNFEIKRKSKTWPYSKIYVEEVPEKYFENLSEKNEYDFSENEEIQTIQLILKPQANVSGTIISRWKLFYVDNNYEKRAINGAIPLKAIIQTD